MFKRLIALSIIFNFISLNTQALAVEQVQSFGRTSEVQVVENLLIPSLPEMQVMLTKDISSANLAIGSVITAVLLRDVTLNNGSNIPKESLIRGSVLNVKSAKKAGSDAYVDAKFYHILTPSEEKYDIKARIKTVDETGVLKGGNFNKQLSTSAKVGAASATGGAIAGASVGTLLGGAAAGMALGLVAGVALGTAWIVGRKGKEVYIPIGTSLLMEFEEPLKKI